MKSLLFYNNSARSVLFALCAQHGKMSVVDAINQSQNNNFVKRSNHIGPTAIWALCIPSRNSARLVAAHMMRLRTLRTVIVSTYQLLTWSTNVRFYSENLKVVVIPNTAHLLNTHAISLYLVI